MTNCQDCGLLVQWVRKGRRWHCHNPDGTDHWDLCSKMKWKQVQATGQKFTDQKTDDGLISGFANSIHGTKLSRHSKPHKGPSRLTGQCKACVPPWEVCSTCPDLIGRMK